MYDVIILGAGPAGLSAAIYCKRANLNVLVLDTYVLGGNPNNYLEIENYLGMGKIQTQDLIEKFSEHINELGIEVREFVEIQEVDLKNKIVKTSEEELHCKYLIIATGSKPRTLGIYDEEEYLGAGVHYCAICDGPMYKDKTVAVIGGGNSACEEALGLSKICKKVYIIEFTDKLNAEQTTIDKINEAENIEIITGYALTSIEKMDEQQKEYMLSGEELKDNWFKLTIKPKQFFEKKEETVTLEAIPPTMIFPVNGVFVYIGMRPNLPLLKEKPLVFTNDDGYIYVDENMQTPLSDVYAIGDITNKKYRQVVTAISDGAIAAIHISKKVS